MYILLYRFILYLLKIKFVENYLKLYMSQQTSNILVILCIEKIYSNIYILVTDMCILVNDFSCINP